MLPSGRTGLYLVLDPDHCGASEPLEVADAALRGGVDIIQLRCKSLTDRQITDLAQGVAHLCRSRNIRFLINDRVDIALAVGADGVHLGVDDLPIEAARRIGGRDFVIGFSPETDGQIVEAAARGADYLGIGPVFATTTKFDAGESLGIAEFTRRAQLGGLPAVAIGGITAENASTLRSVDVSAIAVISAITRADDPEVATRTLIQSIGGR